MIKTVIFRCKLDGVSCANVEALKALLERIGAAIQSVHADTEIDSSVEVAQTTDVGATACGTAGATAYFEVKKADGNKKFYFTANDGAHCEITEAEYNAAHATPEQQANLESARKAAQTQTGEV